MDHFILPWSAGRLWLLEGVSPYDEMVLKQGEEVIDQSSYLNELPDTSVLFEPVINLIFYLPFSLVPYELSRAIWMTLLVIVSGLIGYLSLKLSRWEVTRAEKVGIIFFTIFWMPGVNAAFKGVLSPIIIMLILLSIYLILQGYDTKSGFILALTFGSLPTTGLVIAFLIIWGISRRRWSILKAYFFGVVFLLAVTILLLPSWPLDWLRIVYDLFGNGEWIRTPLMNLAGLLPGIANYLSIFLHVALAIYLLFLVITLLARKKKSFTWNVLAMLVIAYLLHVKPSINQLFLLLPAMFMVCKYASERWRLFGRIFTWILLISIFSAPWLLVNPELLFDTKLSIPMLMLSLPILVVVGMIWIRWWVLKIPRLPFEP